MKWMSCLVTPSSLSFIVGVSPCAGGAKASCRHSSVLAQPAGPPFEDRAFMEPPITSLAAMAAGVGVGVYAVNRRTFRPDIQH
jgi:hypothetical protein